MRRAISFLLTLCLLCSLAPMAFAASDEAVSAANALHDLGLFQGVGTNKEGTPNYDLDRAPNRFEAVTMLVRLLGKEDEAKAGNWTTPFTDLVDWAKPYVGYAYANKLTNGVSDTAFGGTYTVTASQYLTFVLRALGYESGKDFQWDKAWELSDKLGFTKGQYNASSGFTRGDVAIVSNNALSAKLKDGSVTLKETLPEKTEALAPANPDVMEYLKDYCTKNGTLSSDGTRYIYIFTDKGDNNYSTQQMVSYYIEDGSILLEELDTTSLYSNYGWISISSNLTPPYNVGLMETSSSGKVTEIGKGTIQQPNLFDNDLNSNIKLIEFSSYFGRNEYVGKATMSNYVFGLMVHLKHEVLKKGGFTVVDLGFKEF